MTKGIWTLILGIALLVLAVLSLLGGAYLLWYGSMPKDSEGYIVSDTNKMPPIESHALVVALVPINMEEEIPGIVRGFDREKIMNVRLRFASNGSKEVFLGIGKEEDVMSYLYLVDCVFADDYYWRVSPRNVTLRAEKVVEHWGDPPSVPPTEKNIWLASATGKPIATMEWVPESGQHWIVIMNSDGSAGLEGNIQLAARFPILGWIHSVFLLIGAALFAVGLIAIRYGFLRPNRPAEEL